MGPREFVRYVSDPMEQAKMEAARLERQGPPDAFPMRGCAALVFFIMGVGMIALALATVAFDLWSV